MQIGFLTKYDSKIINQPVGEELYARSLCRELVQLNGVESAEVYTLHSIPRRKLDIMVYLNDTRPVSLFADKHVLYMQNFYPDGSRSALLSLQQFGFDGFAFFSRRLLELHQSLGYKGIFLPLAADTQVFQPAPEDPAHRFDVVYVGNDIKGYERTMQYLYPATNFDFGLFGNWNQPWHSRSYKEKLCVLSRGPVSREIAASLFSNSRISLNFTDADSISWDAMNLRFYEVLACKGFLMSDRVPSAEQLLKGCVVFTNGGQDLINKIQYYLDRPEERERIAERGYQYVLQHATVHMRAVQLYEYLQEVMSQPSLRRR